ncbi:MAG TPA: DUF559 domain-containing protein [Chloroflexota bacterium]|nr:DUF559 domain-containing protein [Chloroflexota bacterium]
MADGASNPSERVDPPNIVLGRKVDKVHVEAARRLRRAMTPEERMLWKQLWGNRLNGLHFRRQQLIAGFIVAFYCHAAHLVVEVDGGVHDEQFEYDVERDQVLSRVGLTILRVTNTHVRTHLHDVVDLIAGHAGTRTAATKAR